MTVQRVAYVVNVFPKLSESFIANEMAEVLRRGVELRVLSLNRPAEDLRHGIVQRAGLDRYVSYDGEPFADELLRFRPQIIHAHFARKATAKARSLAAGLGVPYSFTAHRYDIYSRPPDDFHERAMGAGAFVTVSEANADYIISTFGVPRTRIHIIPCGVDTERFSPGVSKIDPPHVVCIARLQAVKNHILLLEACSVLRERHVAFRCVLLGDGEERDAIATAITRRNLEGLVILHGAAEQDEVRDWLRRAAVCALSSHSEGMPVSLMEAAACGVPAVATAVGGVPELVEHGQTGLVVPAGDPQALADALECLLRDEAVRERMGHAARERAVARFSVINQVDRLLDVWSAALEAQG